MTRNLVSDPWVRVLRSSGGETTLSLREVFLQSDKIAELRGELATQDVAIFRLLLAVMYRALQPYNSSDWVALRKDRDGAVGRIVEYLDEWRPQFELLGDGDRFFQMLSFETEKEPSELPKLVADVPPNNKLFSRLNGAGLRFVNWDEAARWLVHLHSYDTSGIKTGFERDPNAKNGKRAPMGPGWCGQIGVFCLKGECLWESLLLNLIPYRELDIDEPDFDVPAWEKGGQGFSDMSELPAGPADLFTWQSRRVRLIDDDGHVTGLRLTYGDSASDGKDPAKRRRETFARYETMAPLKYNPAVSKAAGHTVYLPLFMVAKSMGWRGLDALIPQLRPVEEQRDKKTHDLIYLSPRVVEWAKQLESIGHLGSGVLPIDCVTVTWGSQSATVADVLYQSFELPLRLVASIGDEGESATYINNLRDALGLIPILRKYVYAYSRDLLRAAAWSDDDKIKAVAGKNADRFEHLLEQPFFDWLQKTPDFSSEDDWDISWHTLLFDVASKFGSELFKAAGTTALMRRSDEVPSSAELASRFQSLLRKKLEKAQQGKEQMHV